MHLRIRKDWTVFLFAIVLGSFGGCIKAKKASDSEEQGTNGQQNNTLPTDVEEEHSEANTDDDITEDTTTALTPEDNSDDESLNDENIAVPPEEDSNEDSAADESTSSDSDSDSDSDNDEENDDDAPSDTESDASEEDDNNNTDSGTQEPNLTDTEEISRDSATHEPTTEDAGLPTDTIPLSCNDIIPYQCRKECPCTDALPICVYTSNNLELGTCKQAPDIGKCWTSDDCNSDEFCRGASPCGYGEWCAADNPGTCYPLIASCGCTDEARSCADGYQCEFFYYSTDPEMYDPEETTCLGILSFPDCWADDDCPEGAACMGSSLCSCTEKCGKHIGTCELSP